MPDNLAYQEEYREELLDGQIVLMSPRPSFNHNRVAFNIAYIFEKYLEGKGCTVIADGTDLYLTAKDRFVPDMMIVCDREKIQSDGVHGAPDLVVEVLSPSSGKRDRGYKKDIYAKLGVKEYWLVSPGEKSVEQYLGQDNQLVLQEVYCLYPDYLLANMPVEEQAAVVTEFKCSLYDDLLIKLADVFKRMV